MNIEQQLKTLPSGKSGQNIHCVIIAKGERSRRVLVDVRPNKAVWVMAEPEDDDMYTSWCKLKGNEFTDVGAVVVWAARDASFIAQYHAAFAQEPAMRIEL